ncbi:ABC transporter permease [Paenibacillus selenitireducens]|uniref:ABC transporter permease n=1 Tax=Paenibacillus selenitireducens TaxID=1324314 RepID=A0A1T2XF27_9BACL|nr:ABC transporter permease [Paenibacillus selenitireducens]OPA78494.1 ABC transporter permease [Paenibacillus selenitireducens]
MGIPLLRFLFRKMWNTRWMTLSTLLGLIVAVSFTVSIPMYSDGSLKRVVAKSLQEKSDGMPAGSLLLRYQAPGGTKTDVASLQSVDQFIREQVPQEIGFPHDVYVSNKGIRAAEITPTASTNVDTSRVRTMSLGALSGLADKTEIGLGKMYSDSHDGGVIEAVLLDEALYRNDLHIGDVFEYPVYSGLDLVLKVKIVGTVKAKNDTDPYWYQGQDSMMNTFYISEKVFNDYILKESKVPLNQASWYYAFDLREIKTSQLTPLGRTLDRLKIELYQHLKDTKIEMSFADVLDEFKVQSVQLQTLLFTLAAPMIAMVFYFIAMNARQALDKQRSDIAVLRSRGAGTRQITMMYLIEGIFLGAIALLIGPVVGWFMAKSIGSANGFLTFVDRQSIPVSFNSQAILYGSIAVVIAIIASIIPAVVFARASIVSYKQKLARSDQKPFWQKWYLDIVLLGLSGYGYYMFNERQLLTFQTGMTTDQLQVNPFLFFVPALSIFALGLFFLRLFPWILRFVSWIAKKMLPVPLYLTLTQLSRSATSYYPLMILLILTLGLGVYNASAARTIDTNSTERTLYKYGADVIMKAVWEGNADVSENQNNGGGNNGGPPGGGGAGGQGQKPTKMIYNNEPPFEIFKHLKGVEAATRVLETKGSVSVSGTSIGQGNVVGIDNLDFSKVAWFRNDLFPVHPFNYLNLLGTYENAVIIPTNVATKYQIKPGDLISISLENQPVEFVVVGILPYWPTQYPKQSPFFVANLDYIYDQVPLIPYKVWLKMEPKALVAPLIDELAKNNVELASVDDVRTELVKQNKHPQRGGVFGILSLGFLVSIIISLIGYLLFWFFNLSGRVVQFGVLRAMGLSRKQLTGMLLLEQIFTAGLSIVLGVLIGKLSSILFLPFLQTTENVNMQVPPFRIVFDAKDTTQLYIVVGVMMLTGAALLFMHIRRLRVHQAVKMGEER